jgi:hypothetical protein
VGNGSSIRIWKDKWIPSSSSHLAHSPVGGLGQDATVSDLIAREKGCWNSLIMSKIFMKESKSHFEYPFEPHSASRLDHLDWVKVGDVYCQKCLSHRKGS